MTYPFAFIYSHVNFALTSDMAGAVWTSTSPPGGSVAAVGKYERKRVRASPVRYPLDFYARCKPVHR